MLHLTASEVKLTSFVVFIEYYRMWCGITCQGDRPKDMKSSKEEKVKHGVFH
jgi:hypothetical protein